jgi:hypothetical protein
METQHGLFSEHGKASADQRTKVRRGAKRAGRTVRIRHDRRITEDQHRVTFVMRRGGQHRTHRKARKISPQESCIGGSEFVSTRGRRWLCQTTLGQQTVSAVSFRSIPRCRIAAELDRAPSCLPMALARLQSEHCGRRLKRGTGPGPLIRQPASCPGGGQIEAGRVVDDREKGAAVRTDEVDSCEPAVADETRSLSCCNWKVAWSGYAFPLQNANGAPSK